MAVLDHETYCSHIIGETDRLRQTLHGADLDANVPTCPEWTLRKLVEHLSGAHRLAEEVVRTRVVERDIQQVMSRSHSAPESAEELGDWLGEGAELLVAALREAGADTKVWTWTAHQRSGFWARRMACETLVHRADASIAVGGPYQASPELAADAVDEFLEIITSPAAIAFRPELAKLRGNGQTIHLHATDTPAEVAAEWLIERKPDGVVWRREHGKGDVALRGPLTEVLLAYYRRLPLDDERLEVVGDRALLTDWLEYTAI
ncbi:maleylpyruvate isomerase family mycothiol-dependent enzyme [Streptantibioticus ferralitis]|uniref:Maleylpyruvate isomerase family mycothiol-dependent enzyme n=1 Tax=Streptantibioticus ferralitis TaxID=236510 RepID=A0ABT5Z1A6_9ACTN|nr:maleylpyruvate isomerase family mycothiol-dependent enzyme [Streptantibioticus ferralitis]MDF2257617.1 maleylpyruvate isomerase family mycothiol-dependent enzyme [Streptantibioticus ferralitis]